MAGDRKRKSKKARFNVDARTDVVVVDDNERDRGLICTAVEAAGYEVLDRENGPQVLRLLDDKGWTWVPAALVIDLILPELSGYDLIRRLHSKFAGKKVPIIVVSKLSTGDDIIEAQYAGAVAFVIKPFTAEQIQSAIAESVSELCKPAEERRGRIMIFRPASMNAGDGA